MDKFDDLEAVGGGLTLEEMRQALALAVKIDSKADQVLLPLVREMRILQWTPEARVVMWNTVAAKARDLAAQAMPS